MLAFFVWTDTSLISSIKIKESHFTNEKADLFILDLPRVSRRMVDTAMRLGIFEEVHWIHDPQDFVKPKLRRLSRILGGGYYYRKIAEQLKGVRDKKYEKLFSGGLWANTLFLFEFFKRNNPALKIAIVEEGTVNYGGISTIYWCDADSRRRDVMLRNSLYLGIYSKACKAISELYLSCPEGCVDCGNLRICSIDSSEEILKKISSEFSDPNCYDNYRKRKVVLFTQPESENDIRTTKKIIEILKGKFGASQIIVRIHPNQVIDIEKLTSDPDVFIDYGTIPFELMMAGIQWSDKILIARASSCLFYPFYVKHEQPFICFIYQLYEEKENHLISKLSQKIKSLYPDMTRVQIPCGLEEFVKIISE